MHRRGADSRTISKDSCISAASAIVPYAFCILRSVEWTASLSRTTMSQVFPWYPSSSTRYRVLVRARVVSVQALRTAYKKERGPDGHRDRRGPEPEFLYLFWRERHTKPYMLARECPLEVPLCLGQEMKELRSNVAHQEMPHPLL